MTNGSSNMFPEDEIRSRFDDAEHEAFMVERAARRKKIIEKMALDFHMTPEQVENGLLELFRGISGKTKKEASTKP